MKQLTKEKLTWADLQYLKIATAAFVANQENEEIMPKTVEAMNILYEKVSRMYQYEVNK